MAHREPKKFSHREAAGKTLLASSPKKLRTGAERRILILTLGAGVTPAAHRAGDLILYILRRRYPDRHCRAFMHFALDPQHPVMQLHDVFDDCQPQPGPAQLARSRAIDAIEPLRQT